MGGLHFGGHVTYLSFQVATVDLTEACIRRLSKYKGSMLSANLKLVLFNLSATVLDNRLPKGGIKPHLFALVINALGNPADDCTTHGHLSLEVEIGVIRQLIQADTHDALVPDLNETACFTHICDVAHKEGVVRNCKFVSEFEHFVAEISLALARAVFLLEGSGRAGADYCPLGNARVTTREHGSAFFVGINDAGEEDVACLRVFEHLALNFVSHLTILDASINIFAHLHGDSVAWLNFHVPDYAQVASLWRLLRKTSLVDLELSFFVGYCDRHSLLVLFECIAKRAGLQILNAHDVVEEECTLDEWRNLDLDWVR